MANTELEEQVSEEQVEPLDTRSPFALFFELEYVALSGRKSTYDSLASILNDQKIALTPIQFCRHGLDSMSEQGLGSLIEALGVKKLSAGKLADDIASGLKMYLTAKESKISPEFSTLLQAFQKEELIIGAVSGLNSDMATDIMERLGLDDQGVDLHIYTSGDNLYPRADTWLKISKAISRAPRNCLALVSSAASCKAALSAGMRCIAVPDEYTQYQDYSGAHTVVDSFEDLDIPELIAGLFPQPS